MDDRRGQTETIGLALILGLTVISVGALVVFGGGAIDATQQSMHVQSAEHAMSQFDSRAAMVGLGKSDAQDLRFGQSTGGTYTVEPDTGWLRITHQNESGAGSEIIFNETMGALVYENDGTEIAYQGGGVWRGEGGTIMVSPPEFFYRGSTLTLPILRVSGEGSTSGSPTARITQDVANREVYPNESDTYVDGRKYINPLDNGTVTVTVGSKYYRGWADYFRSRTDGNVSVDHENQTASIELIALNTYGEFDMPLEGNDMVFRGIVSHQISNFTLRLFDDDDDSAEFSNLDWSLYVDQGSEQFEINLVDESGGKCGEPARVSIYYTNGSGSYQAWTNETAFTYECEEDQDTDWNYDGDKEDKRLIVDLTSNVSMEYTEVSGSGADVLYYKNDVPKEFANPVTFEGHPDSGEPITYNQSETAPVSNITDHYMAVMGPKISLTVYDQNSDSIEESISTGHVKYGGDSDKYLTYLHVTENQINVTLR